MTGRTGRAIRVIADALTEAREAGREQGVEEGAAQAEAEMREYLLGTLAHEIRTAHHGSGSLRVQLENLGVGRNTTRVSEVLDAVARYVEEWTE